MTKLILLVAIVVACHPDGGPARHPVEAQQLAAPQAARSPADSRPPAVQDTAADAPARQSEASDDTALSAKRWIDANYVNRVKRKVAENWDPNPIWRRIDPKGAVYGTATRHTEVGVSLSPGGELVDIDVTVPSGVKELDDEAVRAFRAAAPFREPPEGLVLKDGRVTFAFSFYFEAGGKHMAWRMTVPP